MSIWSQLMRQVAYGDPVTLFGGNDEVLSGNIIWDSRSAATVVFDDPGQPAQRITRVGVNSGRIRVVHA